MEEPEVLTPAKPDFRQRHLSYVTSTLGALWRRRLYTDLTVVANGKSVQCHRVVLASASPYFHLRLFNRGKTESSGGKVFVREVSGEVLGEVVEFVYSGECRLKEDNAEELLRAAAVFQLRALKDMCESFLGESVLGAWNALRLFKVARATRSAQLEVKAREVIRVNLTQLGTARLFRQLSHQELISVTGPRAAVPPQEALLMVGGIEVSSDGHYRCGNDIFVSGVGDSRTGLVRFHTEKNQWNVLASMSQGRRSHSMVVLGPRLFVLGGVAHNVVDESPSSLHDQKQKPLALVECYDTTSNTWKIAGSLAQPVWGASAVVFGDKIHVFGGFLDKGEIPTTIVQTFSPLSQTCRVSSQLPFPVALSKAVVMNDGLVLILGPSGTVLTSSDCWRFKVAVTIPNFRRALFGMAVHKDCLYVVGGRRGQKVHDDVLEVDVLSGTTRRLSEKAPRPVWGCGFFTVSLDGARFIGQDRVIDRGEEGVEKGEVPVQLNDSVEFQLRSDLTL
ncbi:kelch-like protein 3 [Babylonia areolata]|uniref:kelch-like protein 3 n=1 Tax=Babylonia areolata TaxID=304850 RepID=UPI003FD2491F